MNGDGRSDIADKPELQKTTTSVEFHFREGFRGVRIDILGGGRVLAQVLAKTRFQSGLAHIEILELHDGDEVQLLIGELNLETDIKVDATRPFVLVELMDGNLRVEDTATRPGYV
jgi:hypothetical protein